MTDIRRGDLVTIALSGDFGKPRPAVVLQADVFTDHPTMTVLLLTSTLIDAPLLRVHLEPDEQNNLNAPSQIIVDKAMTLRRAKIGPSFGRVSAAQLTDVERRLALFLGIAK